MAIDSTSSGDETLHPAWARWLVPSVGDLIFVALLSLLVFTTLSVRLLGDAGIGWHIRTGQLILSNHAIPRADPFSSSMAGQPWFAWEWLYDVIVGWLDTAAGLNAVVLFTALIIATTFSWTFRLLLRRNTNFLLAVVLLLLAASASMIHFLARPHVVSWLFTVAWFWILESSEQSCRDFDSDSSATSPIKIKIKHNRTRLLWLLPPLMLLWVNLHGGFLVGFVLLAIYWFSAVWQSSRSPGDRFDQALQNIRSGKRARTLAFTGLLSALATFLNPYGWRLHLHIYRYLSNRFLMDHIDEFQSPNFHGVAQKCFAGLLLLTLVALAARNRETKNIHASHFLVMLFAVYSGLYASRNIPVSSLLLILVMGPWLSDAMDRLAERLPRRRTQKLANRRIAPASPGAASPPFLQRMRAIDRSLRGHLWPVAAIVLTCWIAAHAGKLGSTSLMDAHFDAKRFPVGAVSYLEKHDVPGPVLSPDFWGGYLIYRLYPQTKVVVDDRHDLYGEEFLKSYLKMVHVEPGWKNFLQQHPAGCLLVPKESALANILLETPNWQPVYGDTVAILFIPARVTSK
jgi:hypothetical protein